MRFSSFRFDLFSQIFTLNFVLSVWRKWWSSRQDHNCWSYQNSHRFLPNFSALLCCKTKSRWNFQSRKYFFQINQISIYFDFIKFNTLEYYTQRGTVLEAGGSEASFLLQTYILTKRSFINMSRDFGYYWLRLVIYIVVTICIGTIYLNVGTGYNSILVTSFFHSCN